MAPILVTDAVIRQWAVWFELSCPFPEFVVMSALAAGDSLSFTECIGRATT